MKHTSLLQVVCAAALAATPAVALWPAPANVTAGNKFLGVSSSFRITTAKSLSSSVPSDLAAAMGRANYYALTDTLEPLVIDHGESYRSNVTSAAVLEYLELSLTPGAAVFPLRQEVDRPYAEQDESYILKIPGSSSATITANTTLGLLRGLQTFSQLVYVLPPSKGHPATRYIQDTPFEVVDKPSFAHRGFMLDTARNWFPVSDIKRTLSAMGWAKLNIFHWHIVDSQSWPLILPSFPLLAEKGAYSAEQTYNADEIADIQSFAAERGISVLLEVDMPGHTAVIGEAYPDYVACNGKTPWASYANEPPAGQLRLTEPAVLEFAKELTGTVAALSTSPYFSTGGDEINVPCYMEDPVVNASTANLNDSISTFVSGLHTTLRSAGKTPVVWEEMVLDHPVALGNDTVVMVWISSENAKLVVEQGFRVVHAASDYLYLDCGHGGWVGNFTLGASWCDPYKTWQKIYSFDPYANITAEQEHLVVGGDALLWTEQANPGSMDSYIWPRAAAAAEVFWTGAATANGVLRDVDEALPRLHDWRYRAVGRGLGAVALQPEWCALRPGVCDLTA